MEDWRTGILEDWKDGRMEHWKNVRRHHSILPSVVPSFHPSSSFPAACMKNPTICRTIITEDIGFPKRGIVMGIVILFI
jgi:hypothetical protein